MKKVIIGVGLGLVAATSQAQAWNAAQSVQTVDAVTHQYNNPNTHANACQQQVRAGHQYACGGHTRGRAGRGYVAPRAAGQSRAQRQAYYAAQQQRKAQMLAQKRRLVQQAAQQRQIALQKQRQIAAQRKAAAQRQGGVRHGHQVAPRQAVVYQQNACGGHVRGNAGRAGYRVQHASGQSRAQRQAYYAAQQQRKAQMLAQKRLIVKKAAQQRNIAQQKRRQMAAQQQAAAQRKAAVQRQAVAMQKQRLIQQQRQLAAKRQAIALQKQRLAQQQHRLAAQRQAAARQRLHPIQPRVASNACGTGTASCGTWSVVMNYKPQQAATVHRQVVRQQQHVAVMQPQAAYLPPVPIQQQVDSSCNQGSSQQVICTSQQMLPVGADCNSGGSQQAACAGGWQRAAGMAPNSRQTTHKAGAYHYG